MILYDVQISYCDFRVQNIPKCVHIDSSAEVTLSKKNDKDENRWLYSYKIPCNLSAIFWIIMIMAKAILKGLEYQYEMWLTAAHISWFNSMIWYFGSL